MIARQFQHLSLSIITMVAFGGLAFPCDTLAAEPPASTAASNPNIIVILADDLGYGDLGCYNPNSKIPTPNLDRLASEGMRFTDAHAGAASCSPSRYALLTGRYAWRSSLKRGNVPGWGKPIIPPERLTLASMLKQTGYATAAIGKWHLGWNWPTKDGAAPSSITNRLSNVDFTKRITGGPCELGFDYYFGVDLPNFPPYCFIENDHTVGIPSLPDDGREKLFNRPGPMLPGWKLVEILPKISQRAVQWLETKAKSEKPFFLYLSLTSPHYPVVPAPEFKGKSKAGDYGDYVAQTDWTVGQVLDALRRTGVTTNTLVFFASDNGPEVTGEVNPGVYDRAQKFEHYSSGELRGAKRDTWEGGHRLPLIACWPGHIPSARVNSELICQSDLFATIAALVGTSLPPNAAEDSFNQLPLLLGIGLGRSAREAVVHHSGSGKFAIRKGDWVLIDAPSGDENGPRGEPEWFKQERGYATDKQPYQLFNVHEDLSERKNHAAECSKVVRELKDLLEKYKTESSSNHDPAPKTNSETLMKNGGD